MSKIKVTLVQAPVDPYAILYGAFKLCYSDMEAKDIWEKINNGSMDSHHLLSFVDKMLETGHLSPLRQINFVFAVDNISRVATAQFNRHVVGINRVEVSQRYVNIEKGMNNFIKPKAIKDNPDMSSRFDAICSMAMEFYSDCVKAGIKKEDARYAVPIGVTSREQFTMNLESMRHFLALRMCLRAQKEIRSMAYQIFRIMKKEYPVLAKILGRKCSRNVYGFCDESKNNYKNCRIGTTGMVRHKSE